MPERTQKATIAAANQATSRLGEDYTFTRDPATSKRRRERRRARADQAKALVGSDLARCIAPGCNLNTTPTLLDDIEFPICSVHAAAVWESVQRNLTNPDLAQAFDALRARRDAILLEQTERIAQAEPTMAREDIVGQVYYVRVNGLIKVGWSSDLENRIRSYGANAVLLAHYPGTRRDETALHQQLSPSRAKGREWYADDAVVQAFANRAVREHGGPTVTVTWTEPKRSSPKTGKPRR